MKKTMQINDTMPWWRYGYVWLMLSGPIIVIVACFITIYIAITRPDPVIDDNYYRNGMEINKTLNEQHDGLAPALQGRNHAGTGVKPAQP